MYLTDRSTEQFFQTPLLCFICLHYAVHMLNVVPNFVFCSKNIRERPLPHTKKGPCTNRGVKSSIIPCLSLQIADITIVYSSIEIWHAELGLHHALLLT